MIIKNLKDLHAVIDKDVRLNYNSTAEFGRKVGRSRNSIASVFNCWKDNNESNTFNIVCDILEKAGYEISIDKK